ncbi:trifunctional aldehyde reductase/xylose reductase/glucose 1-dehydrogenase (NADP(+)) [Hanseniaspora vineae]
MPETTKLARTVTLNNGMKMPIVSLGCWKIPNDVCANQVYEAIKLGYRSFDGACDYGNEVEVGQGIKRAIDEKLVERKDLFVISKLWNNYHHPDHVEYALDKTLKDMGLEYLDLYYIHFPIAFKFVPVEERYPPGFYTGEKDEKEGKFTFEKVTYLQTWQALEKLVHSGKIKSLGVSNVRGVLIQDLLNGCSIKPQCLQIEHHPYLTQENLVQYAKNEDIQVVAYSSFGPASFLEMDVELAKSTPSLFEHEDVVSVANKYKVSPSDVLLRWATQNDVAVIPKSSKPERLLQNLQFEDKVTLSKEDWDKISKLNKNVRFNDPWSWNNADIPTFA